MAFGIGHSGGMSKKARQILADNLNKALESVEAAGVTTTSWARMKGLQRKQVERVAAATVGCSVDFLDELAKALGVQPWQLLVPDLDARLPPLLAITPDDLAKIEAVRANASDLMRRFTLGREE